MTKHTVRRHGRPTAAGTCKSEQRPARHLWPSAIKLLIGDLDAGVFHHFSPFNDFCLDERLYVVKRHGGRHAPNASM